MKKVIDIENAVLAMFIINKAFKSKFKRYWGIATVDEVEVFNERFYYFYRSNPGYTKSDGVQKLLKTLGVAKMINDSVSDVEGIDSAWFYFNTAKATDTVITDLSNSLLASRVEASYTYGVWYNSVIIINATEILDGVMPKGVDGRRVFNAQEAEDWLLDNYSGLVNSSVQSSTELHPDDEEFTDDVMAKYVLLDKTAEVFDIEITGVSINGTPTASGLVSSVAIEMRFKRNTLAVDEDSAYVGYLKPVLEQKTAVRDMNFIANSRAIGIVEEEVAVTNDLFYNGQLRASTLQLERSEFSRLVRVVLDMDYKKYVKKRKWYQKLIAVVILVIIVWVSWGWGAALAGTAATTATTIAYAATIASLMLSLVVLAATKAGYGDLVGFYGGFIKIFGIVGTVLGITAVIQSMVNRGIVELIKAKVAELAIGLSKFSASMMLQSLTYVGQVTNMILGNKLKKISNANNSITERIAEQEEELYDMYDKEFNLPLEALTWQNSPLKVDDAQFEVDYLYEPTKTNICRRSFF